MEKLIDAVDFTQHTGLAQSLNTLKGISSSSRSFSTYDQPNNLTLQLQQQNCY